MVSDHPLLPPEPNPTFVEVYFLKYAKFIRVYSWMMFACQTPYTRGVPRLALSFEKIIALHLESR